MDKYCISSSGKSAVRSLRDLLFHFIEIYPAVPKQEKSYSECDLLFLLVGAPHSLVTRELVCVGQPIWIVNSRPGSVLGFTRG